MNAINFSEAVGSAPGQQKTPEAPEWSTLVPSEIFNEWHWMDGKLMHNDAKIEVPSVGAKRLASILPDKLIRYVYATQNRSLAVKSALTELLGSLSPGQWGLNIGSGSIRLHERILNLDICYGEAVDVVIRGAKLPFADN